MIVKTVVCESETWAITEMDRKKTEYMEDENLRDYLAMQQISGNCFILICEVINNKEYRLSTSDAMCISIY